MFTSSVLSVQIKVKQIGVIPEAAGPVAYENRGGASIRPGLAESGHLAGHGSWAIYRGWEQGHPAKIGHLHTYWREFSVVAEPAAWFGYTLSC